MSDSPIFDKSNPQAVSHVLTRLEERLGLPRGFCEGLFQEDDWSLVVKLSALVETALTQALAAKLNHPELEEPFSYVPLGDSKGGKAEFAHVLKLLDRMDRTAVLHLSRLRNHRAHRVQDVTFELKRYLDGDPEEQKEFVRHFGVYLASHAAPAEVDRAHHAARDNPKRALWGAGLVIVALLAAHKESADSRQKLTAIAEELTAYVLQAEGVQFNLTGVEVPLTRRPPQQPSPE